MPHWMELNTIYFFNYDGEKDSSEFVMKINCNDIIWADLVETDGLKMKTRFSFRLELQDKVHIFLENSAINVNNWLQAVKTGKRCEHERLRAHTEELQENIDMVLWHYRRKEDKAIMDYCKAAFSQTFQYDTSDSHKRFENFMKAANASHLKFKHVGFRY